MGHFSGERGRLSLVATADDMDASILEPVEESFQGGAGHCADLVPDDHSGNELPPHPFRRPLRLATPSEAVVGLGLDTPGLHLFGQAMGRDEDEGISLAEELDRSRGFAAAPAAACKRCLDSGSSWRGAVLGVRSFFAALWSGLAR